jgi:hypothetical protein
MANWEKLGIMAGSFVITYTIVATCYRAMTTMVIYKQTQQQQNQGGQP